MAGLAPALIAPLRAGLVAAGFPADTIKDDGSINPAGLLAGAYDEVEFRSSATPTLRLRTADMLSGPPNPFINWLRPTVVLRGKLTGETVIAPAGVSKGGSILPAAGVAFLLLGAGYALGRASR